MEQKSIYDSILSPDTQSDLAFPLDIPIQKEQSTMPMISPESQVALGETTEEMIDFLSPHDAMIQGILKHSPDPAGDMDKLISSAYLAQKLNLPLANVFENHDTVAEEYWGRTAPAKTNIVAVRDAWKSSDIDQNMALAYWRQMMGDETPELQKQIDLWKKEKPGDDALIRSWPVEVFKAAANMAPYMWNNFKYSAKFGVAGAGVGALYGAIAGPAAEVSIPALAVAGFTRGMSLGSKLYTLQAEAGLNYGALVDQGIPKDIARAVSFPVGIVNAAWEQFQIKNIPGWAGMKASLLGRLGADVAKNTVFDGALTKLARMAVGGESKGFRKFLSDRVIKEYVFRGLIVEPLTEVFQESSNITSEAVARAWANMAKDPKVLEIVKDAAPLIFTKENGQRLLDTYKQTAESMLVLGAGGLTRGGMRAGLKAVAEGAKATEAATTAEVSPVMGPLTREKGALATEVKVTGKSKEGQNATLVVGDAAKQERYGYVNFETVGDAVFIKDVVSESAAQDVSREMILELGEKNPGKTIEWNPVDEAGVELKEDLIAKNPLGSQVGLNWTPTEVTEEAPRMAITRDYFSQQMTKLFNLAPEEADAMVGLAEALSANAGLPVEDWLNQYITPEVTAKTPESQAVLSAGAGAAATTFMAEGKIVPALQVDRTEFKGRVKAVFSSMQGADFHLATHEFFHMVERLALSPDQVKGFERAIGKLRETWTVPDVERLADLFEEYLSTGQAPTAELKTLFQKIAEIFNQIVSFLTQQGHEALSPEFKAAYDALFAKPESGVAQNIRKPVFPRVSRAEVTMPLEQAVIQPKTEEPVKVSAIDPKAVPVEEVALSRITLSKDVPQFKKEANAKGVIEELKGKKYLRLGTAPIVLWERTGGELEVITGRHRFDLAQRLGEESIPSQIVRESEGFTAAKALTFDAESNIRDGMGSIEDYVIYFRATEIDEGTAEARGLLGTDKGRKGFAIGRYATDGLLALYFGGEINETKAAGIAAASRGDPRLTAVGIKNKAASAEQIVQQIEILKTFTPSSDVQTDMFGNEVYEESDKLAAEQVKKLHELKAEQSALSSMNKLSKGEAEKTAGKYGFKAGDTRAVKARMAVLAEEIPGWSGKEWISDPAKIAELKARSGVVATALFHPAFELQPLTEEELAQQRAKETAQAKGKATAATQQTFGFAKKTDAQMKDEKAQLALFHAAPEEVNAFNERAVKEFGVTTDPEYAAWILTTGEMLDFRTKGLDYFGKISEVRMPHGKIWKVLGKGQFEEMSTAYMEAWKRGAVRMDFNKSRTVIQSVMNPTPSQLATIGEWIGQTREIGLEKMSVDANAHDYDSYKDIMSPTIDNVADFYTAAELYTRKEDTHLYHAAALREGDENTLWTLRSEEVIREKMKGPMPAESVRSMLVNAGVKADEMKWMGLDDLLAQGGKLTPEQILSHLAENGLKMTEVMKGDTSATSEDKAKFDAARMEFNRADLNLAALRTTAFETLEKAGMEQARRINLVNYLTDPWNNVSPELRKEQLEFVRKTAPDFDWDALVVAGQEYHRTDREMTEAVSEPKEGPTKFASYQIPGGENYREMLFQLPPTVTSIGEPGATGKFDIFREAVYRGSHWDELNVVAHTRFNDRVDSEGKRTLFIEEIQSDWHQAGREHGYAESGINIVADPDRPGRFAVQREGSKEPYLYNIPTREEAERVRVQDLGREPVGSDRVPSAPFSKTWHEMAFRRMVRWAADNGYDSVGWTTGEQQAERYALSKQLDNLTVKSSSSDETMYVVVGQKGGDNIYGSGEVTAAKLPEIIGKELAARAIRDIEVLKNTINPEPGRTEFDGVLYAGVDLKVGGEGMKGFYDKILVDYANKFGKRFGAKAGEAEIGAKSEAAKLLASLPRDLDINERPWATIAGNQVVKRYATREEAVRGLDRGEGDHLIDLTARDITGTTVHSLPITDSMRESVGKGIALFHPDMENADAGASYASLIRKAANYDTAEEFQKDMEETFGEADPAAADRYQRLWDAAHPPETPPVEAPKTGIPMPEQKEQEYDYGEKMDLAQTISDPALAQKVEQGDITDAEIDKATGKGVSGDEALKEKLKTAQAKIDEALATFTPEEQYILTLADELSTITAFEGKAKRMSNKIASLRGRLKTALKKNVRLSLLLADTAEGFKFDADIQKAITDERIKLVQLTETDKRLQQKARMYAERRAAMAKFRDQVRGAMAERRALMQLKETRKKLIRQIMAPPSRMVEFLGYADRIQEIQEQLDPDNHRVKTLEERKASKAFFDANPDAAALVPKATLELIYSVPVQQLTLAQLEELNELVQGLRKMGKMKRSLILVQDKRAKDSAKKTLVNTVLRGKALQPVIGAAKKTGVALKAYMMGLKPGRIAQLLDGYMAGQPQKGEFWNILQERPNEAWNSMHRMMDKRHDSVISQLDRLKITLDPLALKRLKGYTYLGGDVDIDGFRFSDGKMPTTQKVMYWYLGMQNDRSRAALLAGNKYPLEVVEKAIAKLPGNVKELADLISKDWDDNFPRYREAYINDFNEDLPKEDHYVTMNRLEISYKTREEKVAAELTGRWGLTKHYVDRGSTHARIDISDEHQQRIADDLMSVWMESVRDQEGFIYQNKMIRDMHSVLESDEVRQAVQQKFGPDMNKWIKKYVNDLAQDEAYSAAQGIEKWSRIARSNAAVAWLGFNVLSNAKQLIGWVNALADVGPLRLASAAAQFAAGQGKSIAKGKLLGNTLIDFVEERSEFVKHRQISQELEDMKRLDMAGYQLLVKKLGALSMKSLEVIDKVSVVIGWKAAYDKATAKNVSEAEAIKYADEVTVRTQPSMRVQDMAEMYRGGEVQKWFTMFTSDLNATYNRIAFDVPAALRNGMILQAFADMLSFALAGVWIAIASGALHGDDEEKKKRALMLGAFSQYFDAIPFVGSNVMAALSGKTFQSGGVRIFPAIEYIQQIPHDVQDAEWGKALAHLAESAALAFGVPMAGPRRAIKAFTMDDWEALLGWQNKKE